LVDDEENDVAGVATPVVIEVDDDFDHLSGKEPIWPAWMSWFLKSADGSETRAMGKTLSGKFTLGMFEDNIWFSGFWV
jgi:hypothetical protein